MNTLNMAGAIVMSPVAKIGRVYAGFIFGRLIVGVTTGVFLVLAVLIIIATVHPSTLCFYLSGIPVAWYLGYAVAQWIVTTVGYDTDLLWYIAASIPGFFALVSSICLRFTPETVPYLIAQENKSQYEKSRNPFKKKSYKVLRRLRVCTVEQILILEYFAKVREIKDELAQLHLGTRYILRNRRYWRQLGLSVVVLNGEPVIGSYVVSGLWDVTLTALFPTMTHTTFGVFEIGLNCCLVLVIVLIQPITSRYGNRIFYILGVGMTGIGHVLLFIGLHIHQPYLQLVGLIIFEIGSAMVFNGYWTLPAQITTAVTRPTVLSMSYASFVATTIMFQVFPIDYSNWNHYIHFAFLVMTIIWAVIMWLYFPETHKKSVQEVQRLLLGRPAQPAGDNLSEYTSDYSFSSDSVLSGPDEPYVPAVPRAERRPTALLPPAVQPFCPAVDHLIIPDQPPKRPLQAEPPRASSPAKQSVPRSPLSIGQSDLLRQQERSSARSAANFSAMYVDPSRDRARHQRRHSVGPVRPLPLRIPGQRQTAQQRPLPGQVNSTLQGPSETPMALPPLKLASKPRLQSDPSMQRNSTVSNRPVTRHSYNAPSREHSASSMRWKSPPDRRKTITQLDKLRPR